MLVGEKFGPFVVEKEIGSGAMGVVLTRTDAQGHYRLTGMPKGKGNEILVVPPRDLPYLSIHKPVPDSIGLDPVTVDVELRRGVWIEGKITNTRGRAVSLDMAHTRGAWVEGSIIDRVTGKPLRGGVQYFALNTNPNLPDYDGFADTNSFSGVGTKEDGSYRVVGLPGPGLVAVFSTDQYLRARERDDEYGTREFVLEAAPYVLFDTNNISALARIDPPKGVDAVKRDVMLDPGWTFTGTVLGPDGKPVPGVRGFGLTASGAEEWAPPLAGTASFTVQAFNPRRPRDVLFQHLEKGLTGVAHPPKENGGSVTVRLEPGATVTGRLVDTDGKPRAGVELEVAFRPKGEARWNDYSPRRVKTDRDGGLRLEALLPGYEFRLNGDKGQLRLDGTLRSGQAKDLGDVLMK